VKSDFRNRFQTLSLPSFVCQAFYCGLCRNVISVRVSCKQLQGKQDGLCHAFLFRQPLTTIRDPREPPGHVAFEASHRMLRVKLRRGNQYYLATELVVRSSTAQAATPTSWADKGMKPEMARLTEGKSAEISLGVFAQGPLQVFMSAYSY